MSEKRKRFLGRHYLIEMFDCDPSRLNNKAFARHALVRAARKAHSTIVRTVVHNFSPHGVSGVVVIAESHVSIHEWPEHRYVAADAFMCGGRADPQRAALILIELFGAERHRIRRLRRGLFGPKGIRS